MRSYRVAIASIVGCFFCWFAVSEQPLAQAGIASEDAQPPPRLADGSVNLGSPSGRPGMWSRSGARPFLYDGVSLPEGSLYQETPIDQLSPDRFPKPLYTEVPFQPWARALYERRARNLLEPYTRCKPSTGPRLVATAYGTQFLQLPELERMYIFPTGGPRTYRLVHLDGRDHPQDLTPTYTGHSIGHWEGDTLVVETVGLNERSWFDEVGSPHTEQLRLVERFTRLDFDTIKYEITVDDPGAYSEPWESGFYMSWSDGESFEFICQEFNASPEMMLGTDYEPEDLDRSSPVVPSAQDNVYAKFDPTRPVSLEGEVAHVAWTNPNVHVYLTVAEGEAARTWYVELESKTLLERSGWRPDTLRAGDGVMVEGLLARDGSRQVWRESLVRAETGEAVLDASPDATLLAATAESSGRETPRWPDGQPRLGPPPGESGYWVPASTVMIEEGAEVEIDERGLLADLGDIDRVAPFQQWARDLYAFRQRNFLASDPMLLQCKPPGGPRQFQMPHGIKLVEDRALDRILVFPGGANRDWHIIYTDGRSLDGDFGHDDGNFLYYGRNVGEWQDDTLVIESTGYNEQFWFTNGGLPHTQQLRLTERISRPELDTLVYEVTVDDPGAYTRPWNSRWTLRWVPDEDPPEYYCQDNRP